MKVFTFHCLRRAIPIVALVTLAVTGCSDDPVAPQIGTVRVTVVTTGDDPDTDGYDVTIAGDRRHVGGFGNANVLFTGVPAGTHTIELEGVADNCTVESDAPLMVTVTTDATHEVTVGVTCEATGIRVTTNTTGPEVPPNYEVRIEGPTARIGATIPTGLALFSRLLPGSYKVTLNGVPQECDFAETSSVTVEVANRAVTDVRFDISCRILTAAVEVTISTSGTDLDPNGYRVVAGSRQMPVPVNGVRVLDLLPAGSYSVRIEEVAPNCTLTSNSPQTVEVTSGGMTRDTAHVSFAVACVRTEKLAYVAGSRIVVAYADGSNAVQYDLGHGPSWSPDGSQLLYSNLSCDYYYWYYYGCAGGLRVINPAGGADVQLAAGDGGYGAAWSPDGFTIAFLKEGRIYLLAVGSSEASAVSFTPAREASSSLSWSPDGQKIVFGCGSSADICVVNRDGTGFAVLTDDAFYNVTPAWSPDGTTIAYARFMAGQSGSTVALMNADGTGSRTLTTGVSPSWLPDGSRLVFGAIGGLFTIRPDGSDRTQVTTGAHFDPAWRP